MRMHPVVLALSTCFAALAGLAACKPKACAHLSGVEAPRGVSTEACDWSTYPNSLTTKPDLVRFVSDRLGFVWADGCLHTTTDMGATWTKGWCSTGANSVWSMEFDRSGGGILVGDRIMLTTDTGRSWRPLSLGLEGHAAAIGPDGSAYVAGKRPGVPQGSLWRGRLDGRGWQELSAPFPSSRLDGVAATAQGRIVVVGDSNVAYSDDGGASWKRSSLPDSLRGRSFTAVTMDFEAGWMATTSGPPLLFTVDAGASWRAGPALELAPSAPGGFALVDSTRMWSLNGDILFSTNGGKTWSHFSDGSPGLGDPDQRYSTVQYLESARAIVAFGQPRLAVCRFGGLL